MDVVVAGTFVANGDGVVFETWPEPNMGRDDIAPNEVGADTCGKADDDDGAVVAKPLFMKGC